MATDTPDPVAARELARLFRRNGYLRLPDEARRKKDGQAYKKGYEVRLTAESMLELVQIRRLLARAGFPLANCHAKARQFRQPIYGRQATQDFLAMVSAVEDGKSDRPAKKRPRA